MDDRIAPPNMAGDTADTSMLGKHTLRVLSDIEEYWHDLSRARRIPFRSEVEPSRIDVALPHSFILQRVARGTGRIRVAGSRIDDLLGLDPRGMPLSTFFTPAGRSALQHWFAEVFDRPAIVQLPLVSARGLGRPKLLGGMLLMPLAAEDGSVSLALGALVTEGETGRAPRRFDVPDGMIRISPVQLSDSTAPRYPGEVATLPKIAPRAQEIVKGLGPLAGHDAVTPAPKRAHLRLVVDNT